jgi:GNAT superfamily N-acetyltransferase
MEPEFLNTEYDTLGNKIQIFRIREIGMSPIYTFFLRQMANLIDSGFASAMTVWDDTRCGAVYAMSDNTILGHIVYDTANPTAPGALWITLSAVDELHRGRGIYTILHKYFEQTAKEKGYTYVSSYVHVKNLVRKKSAEKVGMNPMFHLMVKKLDQ